MILRTLAKLVLGAVIGGVIGHIVTGDDTWVFLWAFGLPVFILLSLAAGAREKMRPRSGAFGLARIDTIQRTGIESNGSQLCDMRLVVVPESGRPYSTSTRAAISNDDLRLYNSGTVFVVAQSREGVTIVPTPTPEWASRVTAAKEDPSLIPSSTTVTEWTPTPTKAVARRPRLREAVVSILIIVAGAAISLIPAYGQISRTAQSWAVGDFDGTNPLTGRFQQEAIDEIAQVAGSYQFTSVSFSTYAIFVDGLTSADARTVDSYSYRYGRAFREGPATIQPSDLDAELFDASQIDFSLVAVSVEDAIARSALDQIEGTYAYMRRLGGGDVELSVSISGPYETLTYVYDTQGRLIAEPER